MKEKTSFSHFTALDVRVGRVALVENAETKKPLYRVTVDFGGTIGKKVSIAGYTGYAKDELLGRLVAAVINLEPKRMGPELSEILILGAVNAEGKAVYLTPESEVPLGAEVV